MHSGQEGAESKNILPHTRDVGLQGANVASNEVVHDVSHSGADLSNSRGSHGMGGRGCIEGIHSCCNVCLVLGSSGLQGLDPLVRMCVFVLTRPPGERDHWPLPPIKAGWHSSLSP